MAIIVLGLLSVGASPSVAGNTQKSTPVRRSPSKPASRSSATSSKASGHTGNRGPSANGRTMRGPTANSRGAGVRTTGVRTGARSAAFGSRAPRGSSEHMARNGSMVRTRSNGRVSDIHDAGRGMDIHHGLNGNRSVSITRRDGSRMVFARGRPGFVGHPYSFRGQGFERRAYFYHGHSYDRFYRGFGYHGVFLNVYAPGFYFGPGYYGWAYNPWAEPIAFSWGWGGNPWYGYYGYYFQPYPVYPSAAYWLTDYMISQDLQTDYAAHQQAGETDGSEAAAGAPPELTPNVKQQVSDEINGEIALENQEATETAQNQNVDPGSSGIARILADGRPHVFVAGDALDLVDASGMECGVSDGDVLLLQTPPSADATAANLVVLASKGGDECAKADTVTVQLTDLQEMQNQMRATIDQGLQKLQAKQGTGGLPQAPPSAQAPPVETAFASNAPPPSPQDETDLQQEGQQADQADREAGVDSSQAGSAPTAAIPPPPAPVVSLGQTSGQVQAELGAPTRVVNLGPKVIYFYNGEKVVLEHGQVSNIEPSSASQ